MGNKSLSSLNFYLRADITQFQTALRAASTELKRTGEGFKRVGSGMAMYVTTPIAAATTAMLILTNRSAEFADKIDEMSERTGVARGTLQELSFVAGQIGIDLEGIERAIFKFNKSMGDAANGIKDQSEAFDRLGIEVVDNQGNLKDYNDVFTQTIGKLSEMENETERNYLAMVLFGRGAGQTITPLLELGQDGIQQLIDRARELGVVMGDEQIKALAEYNDAMEATKQQLAAVGRELTTSFADLLSKTVIPLLQDRVIPAIRQVVQWFNGLSPAVKNNILIFTGLAAAIGPVLLGIGLMTSQVIPGLLMAIKGVIAAFSWLTAAIAANPIGAFAVFITAAATALGLFRTRTREAADEQHKLGQEIAGVNNEVGKQIWEQIGVRSMERLADGTYQVIDNMSQLQEKVKSLTKGELEALKSFLESEYSTVTREAENATSDLRKALYADDLNRVKAALDVVNSELTKFTETTKKTIPQVKSLQQQISELEEKLWKEVLANDANATSTARMLDAKQRELQYYREKKNLLLEISKIPSITPDNAQVDPGATMGPEKSDVLFEREIEGTKAFTDSLRELSDVAVDVSDAVANALGGLAELAGETLAALLNGTFQIENVFTGILKIIGGFLKELGSAMIAMGVARLALEKVWVNPYAAIAIGMTLVALGAMISNLMIDGMAVGGGGGNHGSGGGSLSGIPRAANGAIVTGPTLVLAGEGTQDEAILPINSLMNNIHSAIAYSGRNYQMHQLKVEIVSKSETRLKGSDIYLSQTYYQRKLSNSK